MNNDNYTIKFITAIDTYAVRHPILRQGRPASSCTFEGDDDKDTFHLGVYFDHTIIAVATFLNRKNELFNETLQYQLRGMAVLESHQAKGCGKLILRRGEALLKRQKIERLWCNARITAVNFYLKEGFAIEGNPFEIANVGKHYLMTKAL